MEQEGGGNSPRQYRRAEETTIKVERAGEGDSRDNTEGRRRRLRQYRRAEAAAIKV